MQNEFGFEHNATKSRFVAKRMSEILNTYIAFKRVIITLRSYVYNSQSFRLYMVLWLSDSIYIENSLLHENQKLR